MGIKLWTTNQQLYPEVVRLYQQKRIDYLELKYVQGGKNEGVDILRDNKIPIIIHTPNTVDGVCFSDGNLEKNLPIFQEIERLAAYFNTEGIIIHPEVGTAEQFLEFLRQANNDKIIIENMPRVTDVGKAIGYAPDEIKKFVHWENRRFCLDFCHAIKAACSLRKEYREFIKEFLQLQPAMFHLCGGYDNKEMDEHLNLWEGNFDMPFLKKCIEQSAAKMVTLETPKGSLSSLENDVKNGEWLRRI